MIKINLAARKQSQSATGVKTSATGVGRLDWDSVKESPLRRAVLPLVVGLLASYTLDSVKENELKEVDDALGKLNAEKPLLQKEAGRLKDYEQMKKSLESDEFMIRSKIETIQKLIAGRNGTVKLLTSLVSTAPKEVWLTGLQVKGSDIGIKGYSTGFASVSDFMKNLSENANFSDLMLKSSERAKDETGLEVTAFELTARKR